MATVTGAFSGASDGGGGGGSLAVNSSSLLVLFGSLGLMQRASAWECLPLFACARALAL